MRASHAPSPPNGCSVASQRMPVRSKTLTVFAKTLTVSGKALTVFRPSKALSATFKALLQPISVLKRTKKEMEQSRSPVPSPLSVLLVLVVETVVAATGNTVAATTVMEIGIAANAIDGSRTAIKEATPVL